MSEPENKDEGDGCVLFLLTIVLFVFLMFLADARLDSLDKRITLLESAAAKNAGTPP